MGGGFFLIDGFGHGAPLASILRHHPFCDPVSLFGKGNIFV
ncbi:hypothetical protein X805_03360 [Sphaerotilus natans subsp. natans DSM 6575]|uniref:Uncharacterized protein n=1 Tax=Sphaerotilus natans subsp. natans DSM 6575 TaxID=1286631 RepID=A0A059KSN7_9BURK|nr:hypothetical protein X805_03360 [Sphaerotilus natans subsp. natans DSM 6575]